MTPSIGQLVDYCMENRRGKVFQDWTPIGIASQIMYCIEEQCMVYSMRKDGTINGVMLTDKFPKEKVIHVNAALATERGVFKSLVERLHHLNPGYKAEATRRGRRKIYDTPRLFQKITKGIY